MAGGPRDVGSAAHRFSELSQDASSAFNRAEKALINLGRGRGKRRATDEYHTALRELFWILKTERRGASALGTYSVKTP